MSVVQLSAVSVNSEFNAFSQNIKFFDWVNTVQSIVQATSLPITIDLTKKDIILPVHSMASKFGHNTLGEFIESSHEDAGLDMDWGVWSENFKAFNLKHKYGIYENESDEIIKQFNDISKLLGREPIDSSEYHKAKDDILNRQKREAELRHQNEVRTYENKVSTLTKEISKLNQDISSLSEQLGNSVPQSTVVEYLSRIEDQQVLIQSLKQELASIKNSVGFIESSQYQRMEADLSKAYSFIERFREQNKRLKIKNSSLSNKNAAQKGQIKTLKQHNDNSKTALYLTGSLFLVTSAVLVLYIALLA